MEPITAIIFLAIFLQQAIFWYILYSMYKKFNEKTQSPLTNLFNNPVLFNMLKFGISLYNLTKANNVENPQKDPSIRTECCSTNKGLMCDSTMTGNEEVEEPSPREELLGNSNNVAENSSSLASSFPSPATLYRLAEMMGPMMNAMDPMMSLSNL